VQTTEHLINRRSKVTDGHLYISGPNVSPTPRESRGPAESVWKEKAQKVEGWTQGEEIKWGQGKEEKCGEKEGKYITFFFHPLHHIYFFPTFCPYTDS